MRPLERIVAAVVIAVGLVSARAVLTGRYDPVLEAERIVEKAQAAGRRALGIDDDAGP
jgi:uncharacterized membrane protein